MAGNTETTDMTAADRPQVASMWHLYSAKSTNEGPQKQRPPTTLPSNQPARPSLAPSPTPVSASLLPLPPPPPPNRLSQKRNRVLLQDLTSSSSSRTISRGTTLSSYQHTISLQPMKMAEAQQQARQVTKYRLLKTWIGCLTCQEGRRGEQLYGRCWIRRSGTM